MSLLDEMNRNDQRNRLVSTLNKRNKQLSSLTKQKEACEMKCKKLEEENAKLKAALNKAPKSRTSTKKKSYQSKREAKVELPQENLISKEPTNDDTE